MLLADSAATVQPWVWLVVGFSVVMVIVFMIADVKEGAAERTSDGGRSSDAASGATPTPPSAS
jgi:hypothetical protein